MKNERWIVCKDTSSGAIRTTLQLVSEPVPDLGDGDVLVRNIYLSVDPTNRMWLSEREQYLPKLQEGDTMRGLTLGVVERSRAPSHSEGQIVIPSAGAWALYSKMPARHAKILDAQAGVPLTAYLSVLGVTGLTAYFGLLDVARPCAGETVVIDAAAGAVGSIVGQIARLKGCRVIGIAGGAAKCAWLLEIGFDAAIDYKAEDVAARLDALCPDGIDIAFENVGGSIMDAIFSRLNVGGRMVLCGLIASYGSSEDIPGPTDFGRILVRRLRVQGFIIIDYIARFAEARAALSQWVADGELVWRDDVIDGIDQANNALEMLFSGTNTGKLMVKLSPDPTLA